MGNGKINLEKWKGEIESGKAGFVNED